MKKETYLEKANRIRKEHKRLPRWKKLELIEERYKDVV